MTDGPFASVMKTLLRRFGLLAGALGCLLALSGCEFDVPLSAEPDRDVDARLLGEWVSPDGWMVVRRFDAGHYVVFHNGTLYRAWHSSVAGRDFITVQSLGKPEPKYYFFGYTVDAERGRLDLQVVLDQVLPRTITDTAALRAALERVASDPRLLGKPVPFTALRR